MRILFLTNNWVGWKVLEWLQEQSENIVGLIVHPTEKQKYGSEIIEASKLPASNIFLGSNLQDEETVAKIRDLKPDIGLSVYFGYILKKPFLDILPEGCLNLHPAYLPYNRGSYPNVWSIVKNSPAGVTLHYIDERVDTGDIISQKQVEVLPTDTGKILHHRLEQASLELFQQTWPQIRARNVSRITQDIDQGSSYRIRDVKQLDRIDLEQEYKARDLINILRARTFSPYRGAYIEVDGQRIYFRLQLLTEEQLEQGE